MLTLGGVLDALEKAYPGLAGTMRDHVTGKRRAFVRFFMCQEDWSFEGAEKALPERVQDGRDVEEVYGGRGDCGGMRGCTMALRATCAHGFTAAKPWQPPYSAMAPGGWGQLPNTAVLAEFLQEVVVPDASTMGGGGREKPEQFVHSLANGLTVVAERIPGVQSAAMSFLVPAGAATDPEGEAGGSSVLSDWILRGAGNRDSRELTGYLDGLGVQRSAGAETVFMRYGASMLGKNLLAVLPVYADIVQRPQLPEEGFEPALDLALQQLDAIEDEPSQKLSLTLRERHYPYPFGRPTVGRREDLEGLSAEKA